MVGMLWFGTKFCPVAYDQPDGRGQRVLDVAYGWVKLQARPAFPLLDHYASLENSHPATLREEGHHGRLLPALTAGGLRVVPGVAAVLAKEALLANLSRQTMAVTNNNS